MQWAKDRDWSSREEDAELLTPALVLNQVLPAADITPKTHLPLNSHHLIQPQSLFLSSSVKPSEIVPVFSQQGLRYS